MKDVDKTSADTPEESWVVLSANGWLHTHACFAFVDSLFEQSHTERSHGHH